MGRKKGQSYTLRVEISSQHKDKSREEILDELVDKIIEIEKRKVV